jgi:hypothetical protein
MHRTFYVEDLPQGLILPDNQGVMVEESGTCSSALLEDQLRYLDNPTQIPRVNSRRCFENLTFAGRSYSPYALSNPPARPTPTALGSTKTQKLVPFSDLHAYNFPLHGREDTGAKSLVSSF